MQGVTLRISNRHRSTSQPPMHLHASGLQQLGFLQASICCGGRAPTLVLCVRKAQHRHTCEWQGAGTLLAYAQPGILSQKLGARYHV
eukprot:1161952-Pelagomonas_calceolata.AAC.4